MYVSDEQDGRIYEFGDGAKRVVAGGLKRPPSLVVEDAGHLLVLAENLPPNADGTKGALLRVDVATGAWTVLASHLKEPPNLFRLTDGFVPSLCRGLSRSRIRTLATGDCACAL